MKHRVALSGSYAGGNIEGLFKGLRGKGVLQFQLVGREVTLQVNEEKLEEVKKSLKKLGVDNVTLLEWRKLGLTLSGSGKGRDEEELVQISLIPTALGEGVRRLGTLSKGKIPLEAAKEVDKRVIKVLDEAGATDVLYIIQAQKKTSNIKFNEALESATLEALFDGGGLISIE
ncbi:MAG: hypothetical protein ABH950_06575 [Candidatus Altiarchaeota archaeon]